MTVMMSDSLKDIISIGQLTGEISFLRVEIGGETKEYDIISFEVCNKDFLVKAFSSKSSILDIIKSKKAKASLTFMGDVIGTGVVTSVGLDQIVIGEETHDVLIIRAKRDN